jgi:hypothetical protein
MEMLTYRTTRFLGNNLVQLPWFFIQLTVSKVPSSIRVMQVSSDGHKILFEKDVL